MRHILIFNGGYVPAESYGGPVVTLKNMVDTLKEDFVFTIITSGYEHDGKTNLNNITINEINYLSENENVIYLDKKHYNINYIQLLLSRISKIDFIYVNSFFLFRQLKIAYSLKNKLKIPLLIAPRGELEENTFKLKSYKKIPYTIYAKILLKCKSDIMFQATTTKEFENIKSKLNIPENRIFNLRNIPTLPKRSQLSHPEKKENELNLVYLARIVKNKNLSFVLDCLRNVDKKTKIKFDIYGPIEDKDYWEKCEKKIEELGTNIVVNYRGIVQHADVFEVLSQYELFFLPTFSENFGHVISESLWSGTPVLISDQTPWNDVSNFEAGKAFPLGNEELFVSYLISLAKTDSIEMKKIRNNVIRYANNKFDIEELKRDYKKVFEE